VSMCFVGGGEERLAVRDDAGFPVDQGAVDVEGEGLEGGEGTVGDDIVGEGVWLRFRGGAVVENVG